MGAIQAARSRAWRITKRNAPLCLWIVCGWPGFTEEMMQQAAEDAAGRRTGAWEVDGKLG